MNTDLLAPLSGDPAIQSVPPGWATSSLDQLAAALGMPRRSKEPDFELGRRLRAFISGLSSAGSERSYWYHTVSVAGVRDALVTSPSPGVVRVAIAPVAEIRDEALLGAVYAALDPKTVRPLTDTVEVVWAETTPFSVSVSFVVARGADSKVVTRLVNECLNAFLSGVKEVYDPQRLQAHLSKVQGVKTVLVGGDVVPMRTGTLLKCGNIYATYAGTE